MLYFVFSYLPLCLLRLIWEYKIKLVYNFVDGPLLANCNTWEKLSLNVQSNHINEDNVHSYNGKRVK
jgi:hypothetical protein